jgi:membrane protein DedA with SNARE-associated domain
VRHFTALVAGASHLEYKTFILYAWPGGIGWVSLFLTIGYVLGEQWQHASEHAHQLIGVATVIGAIALGIYLWKKKPWLA